MRILYLEDDYETRENYKFILESYFCKTDTAETSIEAKKLYDNNNYDLLLLDIDLAEEKTGLDFAEYVRKKDNDIKIVMLTAFSDRDRLLQAVKLKLDNYLIKPIQNDILIKTIRENLKKKNTSTNNEIIKIRKDIKWNNSERSLYIKNNKIKLTKKEIILLSYLAKYPDDFIEKDSLIVKVWENELPNFSHNQKLTQLIYRLNKKISELVNKEFNIVINHYSIGYKLQSI